MKKTCIHLFIALSIALIAGPALAEGDEVIQRAKKLYENGQYEDAARLLIEDVKKNPESGASHKYLGMALQRMGYDDQALTQLELGFKFIPVEAIDPVTNEVLAELASSNASTSSNAPAKPPSPPGPFDWLNGITGSVSQLFGISKPPAPGQQQTTSFNPMPLPDLVGPAKSMIKDAKRWIKGKVGDVQKKHGYQSWASDIIPKADMLTLVDKSRRLKYPTWNSHPDGLVRHDEGPENNEDWDYWIARFKRSLQYVLLHHMALDMKDEARGAVAVIFSLDNQGHLRGCIYASTASDTLNKCVLKSIRDLNHSRILTFPPTSHCHGYNFRMTWNFGRMIAIVRAYRQAIAERQRRLEEAKRSLESSAKLAAKETGAKAKIKKLPPPKKEKKEPIVATSVTTVKTDVVGLVLPPPKPLELKAVAGKLSDTPQAADTELKRGDVFGEIKDQEIMSWPDVIR